MDNTEMRITGLISTCNKLAGDEVVVETDADLLWMTEVADP